MQFIIKESNPIDLCPDIAGAGWEVFLPAASENARQRDLEETRLALRQAERVIGSQEARIRFLETLSLTDELTGLANRRGFMGALERELTLARRDNDCAGALIMVDLDGFKAINDVYGHPTGDAYLCAVAQALRDGVRGSDIVARLGGDEFGILLTAIEADAAFKRLAKIERVFNQRVLLWKDKRMNLRASFGMSFYTAQATAESVIGVADARLYDRKASRKKSGTPRLDGL